MDPKGIRFKCSYTGSVSLLYDHQKTFKSNDETGHVTVTLSIYLQSDDTLASLDLLIIKVSSLFVCIFHSDINLCVDAFRLCLSDNTRSSDRWRFVF